MEHIVSFSGGKDSTAMLVRMIELGMPIDKIVYADVKKQFPQELDYIKQVETYIERPIITVTGGDWDTWFFGKITRGKLKGKQRGFPLTLYPCWHSREAKFKPLDRICKGNIRYLGFALDENNYKRQKVIKEYQEGKGRNDYVYPLVDWGWTEKDCLDYLKVKGLVNPLYKYFNRLGCYLCPKQPRSSLKNIYLYFPKQWDELKYYSKMYINKPFNPSINSIEDLEKEFQQEEALKEHV